MTTPIRIFAHSWLEPILAKIPRSRSTQIPLQVRLLHRGVAFAFKPQIWAKTKTCKIHRLYHRLLILQIHRHHRVLVLAHLLGEFGYMFRTQSRSQQTRDSHPIRLFPLERELQRQRHLLGGFNYMSRAHSWEQAQEDRLHHHHRHHRLQQLPFEHLCIPSLFIETSR